MDVFEIMSKSLLETIKFGRFLPFFFLYFLLSISILSFLIPMLYILPSMVSPPVTGRQLAILMVNLSGSFIVFLIVILLNLWFTGALVYSLYKKKKFDFSLKYSQKFFWQMLALTFVIFLFTCLSSLLKNIGIFVTILIYWVFMFSLPSIIIKKDKFDTALVRSYDIVKKNTIRTFVFWLFVNFISFIILFVCLFLVALSTAPLLLDIAEITPEYQPSLSMRAFQLVSVIFENYPVLLVSATIVSFFLALSYVFIYTSRTYYFFEISKKRKIRV